MVSILVVLDLALQPSVTFAELSDIVRRECGVSILVVLDLALQRRLVSVIRGSNWVSILVVLDLALQPDGFARQRIDGAGFQSLLYWI